VGPTGEDFSPHPCLVWHAEVVVFVMSDLELPIRGRTYREPEGAHSVVVRGRDMESALQHAAERADCRTLAVISLPATVPDLSALAGRRLLLVDGDSGRLRDFAEVALRADVEVEWIRSARPPFERLAAALLPVGAVVLAAGSSTRMPGSQKLLLEFDGRPMVRHAIEAASEGGCHQVVVVYSTDDVKEAVVGAAELVHNPDAHTGMASSLKAGLRALRPEIEAAVVLLGDQPLVGSRTVAALLRAWRREGSRPAVAVSKRRNEWTPPVVLAREMWDDLYALEGDAGARQILDGHPELLDTVPAPGRPDDIDTPEDYAKILSLFPRRKSRKRA
jgi:CTP:molybdopterin cytidylyltransferase MocA